MENELSPKAVVRILSSLFSELVVTARRIRRDTVVVELREKETDYLFAAFDVQDLRGTEDSDIFDGIASFRSQYDSVAALAVDRAVSALQAAFP